jgi:hypothetical protein
MSESGDIMNRMTFGKALILLATFGAPPASAVTINAISSTPTLIGSVIAGHDYVVTASGVANLKRDFNAGAGLPFTADGKPTYAFPSPYSGFWPNGLDYSPVGGPSAVGLAGSGKFIGALVGSFKSVPSGPGDYFTIGLGLSFTATSSGNLFGLINDCFGCFPDNSGGYQTTLAEVQAVPEPASWAMMIGGFGLAGAFMRRRVARTSIAPQAA